MRMKSLITYISCLLILFKVNAQQDNIKNKDNKEDNSFENIYDHKSPDRSLDNNNYSLDDSSLTKKSKLSMQKSVPMLMEVSFNYLMDIHIMKLPDWIKHR